MRKFTSLFLVTLAFLSIYVGWGLTYFFIGVAVHGGVTPLLMGAIRFLVAGTILLVFCCLKGENIFNKETVKQACVSGFLVLLIGNVAVFWAERYMSSTVVAIMVSGLPLWVVLFDKPQWSRNFTSKPTLMGMVIGLVGVVLLYSDQLRTSFFSGTYGVSLFGCLLLILSQIGLATGSLYSKYVSAKSSALMNTGWQMLISGIVCVIISVLLGELQGLSWEKVPTNAWLALLYLTLVGSLVAYSAYVWLLNVRPAAQVSTYAYVNPLVAVLFGVIFGNEKISPLQVSGLAIIILSVILINSTKLVRLNKVANNNA